MHDHRSRWHPCFLPQDYHQRVKRDMDLLRDALARDHRLDPTDSDPPFSDDIAPPPDDNSQDDQAA